MSVVTPTRSRQCKCPDAPIKPKNQNELSLDSEDKINNTLDFSDLEFIENEEFDPESYHEHLIEQKRIRNIIYPENTNSECTEETIDTTSMYWTKIIPTIQPKIRVLPSIEFDSEYQIERTNGKRTNGKRTSNFSRSLRFSKMKLGIKINNEAINDKEKIDELNLFEKNYSECNDRKKNKKKEMEKLRSEKIIRESKRPRTARIIFNETEICEE